VNPARWSVRRVIPPHLDAHYLPWVVEPPYPMNQTRAFATWRAAFDFADQMSRGLA
jgi:hypothetical protein